LFVTLTHQQVFPLGHRPAVVHRVAPGASTDGTLEAIVHDGVAETSRREGCIENMVLWSGLLYRCDNVRLDHKVCRLDLPNPMDMRAPGAASGVFALESAMDELAVKLGMDPVDLARRTTPTRTAARCSSAEWSSRSPRAAC
jgi:xanthine dehydrogenase YagR molybdenum-binding subunit